MPEQCNPLYPFDTANITAAADGEPAIGELHILVSTGRMALGRFAQPASVAMEVQSVWVQAWVQATDPAKRTPPDYDLVVAAAPGSGVHIAHAFLALDWIANDPDLHARFDAYRRQVYADYPALAAAVAAEIVAAHATELADAGLEETHVAGANDA